MVLERGNRAVRLTERHHAPDGPVHEAVLRNLMLVAIDGPAGAGKSTVARATAGALGFTYLDTGAMYRAAALARAARPDVDLRRVEIAFDEQLVLLDGEDVSAAIRTPQASQAASRLAVDPGVREVLVAKQRSLVAEGDWVAEGRDIGTVVAPDAEVKVWLTAAPEERARRREIPVAELLERDERDATRAASPMRAAQDAVEVDTTGVSIETVVSRIVALVSP